jgi:NADPH-dependent curcumin reductase CurA
MRAYFWLQRGVWALRHPRKLDESAGVAYLSSFLELVAALCQEHYDARLQRHPFERQVRTCRAAVSTLFLILFARYEQDFYETMPADVASGKFKYTEHRYSGLSQVGQALADVQTGRNHGKAVVILADQ